MYTIEDAYRGIETLRDDTVAQYEFPYYALIRVQPTHGPCFHIPAPWFNGPASSRRSEWAGNLPIAQEKRDGGYYQCPFCGEPSFYAGPCQDCDCWPHPTGYENHQALKNSLKKELLRRLDNGMKDLGVKYAEIVLPVPWGAEWSPSPFLKTAKISAAAAIAHIESALKRLSELESRNDVTGVLKRYGAYEKGSFITDSDRINPDLVEVQTRYMEVPQNAYVELFELLVPAIIVKCGNDRRYFVLPPELCDLPGYPPEKIDVAGEDN